MRLVAGFVVALAALVHAALWYWSRDTLTLPDAPQQVTSLSFAPFRPSARADEGEKTSPEQIRADLKVVAPYTKALRTYASTGGLEDVAPIASEFGLKVTIGAWIDKDLTRNEREISNAVALANANRNVNGIVVGNETIFRDEVTVPDLIGMIQRVKRETKAPVTTGEIWHVWLQHPELAENVDFIAAHILPYWEGFPVQTHPDQPSVVDQTMLIYDKLRQAFPGKRIVIAEFGWPSSGHNRLRAVPGKAEQAQVLRDFLHRADMRGIDYNIVEAFDQPWKTFEGTVGAYWGMFDADRNLKLPLQGPVANEDWWKPALVAVMLGILLSAPLFTTVGLTLPQAIMLSAAANVAAAWGATLFQYWLTHYFTVSTAFAYGIGLLLLVPLIVIMLYRISEIAQIAFGRRPQRLLPESPTERGGYAPMVSIHVPAYREQPDMLKATLDSVAALDYPNFECVVIINNTPDPAFVTPIEEHCAKLGPRFKFLNILPCEGFKAGALRHAMMVTAAEAEIIGIIDADYVVDQRWLSDLVPAFSDPQVGLVQAPQDHRDGSRTVMHDVMNAEYAGFFDIGMVQRNEVDSIVVHGTMVLLRREAMDRAGGWSSDTICEDTDLGLSIMELGYTAHYTKRRYGWGLLPDTYEAFRKQRHRWAYGGLQIIKKHWRMMASHATLLNGVQKREFALGWLNWMGAEAIGVIVAILNVIWVPIVAFARLAVPEQILTIPIIAAFVVTLAHFFVLYRLRVNTSFWRMVGAGVAAMGVQLTVAKAVGDGLIKDHLPFTVTAKGGAKKKSLNFPAFWEAVLGALLLGGAGLVWSTNYQQVREVNIFALVLIVQSLPFLAAVWMGWLETSRLNEYANWRRWFNRNKSLESKPPVSGVEVAEKQVEAA